MPRRNASLIVCLGLVASAGGAAEEPDPALGLRAHGPGAVFSSVEAAAVDALTYAYLRAHEARDTERMRAGTIFSTGAGYSYGEVRVAPSWRPDRVAYTLRPRDVARFQTYPRHVKYDVNRANEAPSPADRRSVDVTDPLHRPLFILHPSGAIRVYRGEGRELVEVADLRDPESPLLLAGN